MSHPIRAVYHQGQLTLLDPVGLSDGQQIQLVILSETDSVRAALGDLLVERPILPEDDIDEEALMKEVEDAFRGQPPLSQTLIDERNEGP